jgi:hypothetical protein
MFHIYTNRLKTWLWFLPLIFIISCKKEFNEPGSTSVVSESNLRTEAIKSNTFYGNEVQMGKGKVRSLVTIDKNGVPLVLGVEMTDGVLSNLPVDEETLGSVVLPLHPKAKELTPFDHITVDWHPFGHDPEGIYDIAHFDFHFYKISVEAQNAIPPYEVGPVGFDDLPGTDFIPPLYFRGPGGAPQMGTHWVDLLSPEFNGGGFTSTFLIGSYAGEVTFYEPMIIESMFVSGVSINKDIRQPLKFSPSGVYYPTRYTVYKNANTLKHFVTLEEFIKR